MNTNLRTLAGHVVEFVSATEGRRLAVVIGVPVGFVALLELTANFGVLVLLLAVGLGLFLYTRPTAQATLAAGAYGVGLLLLALFLLELYWNGARGSTEPLVGTVQRVRWLAVAGVSSSGLGLWLRQLEL